MPDAVLNDETPGNSALVPSLARLLIINKFLGHVYSLGLLVP